MKAKIPKCEYCGKQFPKKGSLEKHILSVHDSPKEDSLKQKAMEPDVADKERLDCK